MNLQALRTALLLVTTTVFAGAARGNGDTQVVLDRADEAAAKLKPEHHHRHGRKNIIVVLTDDQDLQLDSVSYMPLLQRHIIDQGISYINHFTSTAICCPSRVALWTGKQPHNTNVTDVNPPHGGFPKFVTQGLNDNYLPVWLQDAGYKTFYTGKMFNSHTVDNYNSPHLRGFTSSDFLLDPYTYSYWNSTYQKDHEPPVSYEGRHTSDVITEKAYGLLEDALASSNDWPFFLTVAPIAPHSNIDPNDHGPGGPRMTTPVPAERHKHLFPDARIPRTPNFNPDKPTGANWISRLPARDAATIQYYDAYHRARLQALQAVDELVEGLWSRVAASSHAEDTYLIYTSDNGFHIGQHRLPPGKECAFEEDIRVPLFIRGPGIEAGSTETAVTNHIDLAPTIFSLAGLELRSDFDGAPIPLRQSSTGQAAGGDASGRREQIVVEYWGKAYAEGEGTGFVNRDEHLIRNNTYKAVRILSQEYNLLYLVWCNNEHELYDLVEDPYQIHNQLPQDNDNDVTIPRGPTALAGQPRDKVIRRLDAMLMVLKSCRGVSCINPWSVLHPDGDVATLQDALQPRFDDFYASQPKVEFSRCEEGYLIDAEGPQTPTIYGPGGVWPAWT